MTEAEILDETEDFQVRRLDPRHNGCPYVIMRRDGERWVYDWQSVYLYSNPDHSAGNALCVIASNEKEADVFCRRFGVSISPADKTGSLSIVRSPIVISADSYYRPELSFVQQDDFSKMTSTQAAELRKALDRDHPSG
jgi:hypothetical protein